MKTYILKCPHCGGNLETNLDRDFFFCQFCGTKIITDSISKNELYVREMEHEEKMIEHKAKMKESRNDTIETLAALIFIALGLGAMIFIGIKFG